VKKAGSDVPVVLVNIELYPETGHDTAEKTEKPVDTVGAVVCEPPGMPFEQFLVHGLYVQRAPQHGQVAVFPQVLSLAFAELKVLQVDTQQYHAALPSAPLPVVSPEKYVGPVRPPILTKTVENHRVQRLHGNVFFNFCRIEGDISQ
jgi:hypothetical protein